MGRGEDTSAERSELERFLDNNPIEDILISICAIRPNIIEEPTAYYSASLGSYDAVTVVSVLLLFSVFSSEYLAHSRLSCHLWYPHTNRREKKNS